MLSGWLRRRCLQRATKLCQPRQTMSTSNESCKSLPLPFLRDSDENNFDSVTRQRSDVSYNTVNGKPSHDHFSKQRYQLKDSRTNGTSSEIDWADGVTSKYSAKWTNCVSTNWKHPQLPRELWTGITESDVRNSVELSLNYEKILHDEGMKTALHALYKFGILLVTDTPTDDEGAGIAALASAVSGSSIKNVASSSLLENYKQGGREIVLPNGTDGPLRTLYGNVWFTASSVQAEGSSVADSAYGLDGLPLHTDMAYMLSPPGLQIFTMVQPVQKAGESIFADGFAAAELLRSEDPHAFDVLCRTDRTYHSIDKATGWHLEAVGPIIETRRGQLVRIRHNDLDRLPDLPPYSADDMESQSFYEELANAHAKWDEILGRDSTRLVMKLRPGDTVLVANQRCMHGRYSFQTTDSCPRAVSGCYVSQDDLNSRFRMENLPVLV